MNHWHATYTWNDIREDTYKQAFIAIPDGCIISASQGNDNQDDLVDLTNDLSEEEKSQDASLLAQDTMHQIKFKDRANVNNSNIKVEQQREKSSYFQWIYLHGLFDNIISLPYIASIFRLMVVQWIIGVLLHNHDRKAFIQVHI